MANALVVPGGKMYVLNVGEGTGVGQRLNFTSAPNCFSFPIPNQGIGPIGAQLAVGAS